MDEEKFQDMEDLMLDYGEMTSLNFNPMDTNRFRNCKELLTASIQISLIHLSMAISI